MASPVERKGLQRHAWWKRQSNRLDENGNLIRPKFVSNHTYYFTTDRDSRVAVKPGKPRQLNYLSQVSVDTASHVITQTQADYADKKDSQCLPSLLTNTIQNLKTEGLLVEEVLADAGYSSGEALKALKGAGVTGYIPNFGQYKAHREGDYYTRARGVKLPFKRIKGSHDGTYQMREYRSNAKDCGSCPLKSKCIGKSNCKGIEDTVDKPLYDKMHQRLGTPKAKRMKKLRQAIVEPVLGTLVNFLAMKRVNTRGLQLANKCMLVAATCYNLKKLLNFNAPQVNAAVIKMKKEVENRLKNAWRLLSVHVMLITLNHHRNQLKFT